MELRYHLDESVAVAVAEGLRSRGIDVTTSSQVGLIGATDESQLSFANIESRIIVSHDDDFLRLHHRGLRHSGIAYCRQGHRSVGQIILNLTWLARTNTINDMAGIVHFL